MPVAQILVLLAAIALLAAAARSSARCVLRRKNIPAEAAKEVTTALSGALFLVYSLAALLACFLAAPQAAESLRQLLVKQQSSSAAPASDDSTPDSSQQPAEMPQGRMTGEQARPERLLLLAEIEERLHRETDGRYQLFGQEHEYIVAEGISGLEDRYIAPSPEQLAPAADPIAPALPPQSISVRDLVSSSDDISSILPAQGPPAPAQTLPQNPPAEQLTSPPVVVTPSPAPPQPVAAQVVAPPTTPQTAAPVPTQQQVPPTVIVPQPSAPTLTAASGIDQQIRAQEQGQAVQPPAVQQVACDEIRSYMDNTDIGVFRYAVTKPEGVVTPWKGPTGSYAVTAGAAHGSCRDYAMQAGLNGRTLRCQFSCARTAPSPVVQASSPAVRPSRSGKEVIRDAMNSSDQEAFLKALTYYGPFSWRSSSGIFYTVSPVRLGNPCREYEVQANIQGRVFKYIESNCE